MNYYAKDCELVLALVCPVGVNLEDVRSRLEHIFRQFRYVVNFVHLSQLVEAVADKSHLNETDRLDTAMERGNALRRQYDRGDFMALLAVQAINKRRNYNRDTPEPQTRTVHVIRSLKHADEVETLRQTYGAGFFLLGVSASLDSRRHHLRQVMGVPDEQIDRLVQRDDKEMSPFGQQTRNVFELADAYITTDDTSRLSDQLTRIIDILFSKPVASPTAEEYAMFMAYAASLRSADLSRQVGAVVVNQQGDIVSTGANDVPKQGGGLYWPGEGDQRDHVRGFDYNERHKKEIAKEVVERLLGPDLAKDALNDALGKLKGSRLMAITEYGRAVHAEMETLLQAARKGLSVCDGVLYATTYPCHNCAKHIVAAGIKEVVYIEPYPKSYATTLHKDAISDDGAHDDGKVRFRQFVGIGPRRFIDLFSMRLSSGRNLIRKVDGKLAEWSRENAELRVPMGPLSYLDSEVSLVKELNMMMDG